MSLNYQLNVDCLYCVEESEENRSDMEQIGRTIDILESSIIENIVRKIHKLKMVLYESGQLVNIMHSFGINVKYIGLMCVKCKVEYI